jgi:two-component system, NtrC family, response regulator AtoC
MRINMQHRGTIKVFIIEDEDFDVQRIKRTLQPFQDQIEVVGFVSDGEEALDVLRKHPDSCDIIITDYQLTGGLIGESLIKKIKAIDPTLQIIVISKMTINSSDTDFARNLIDAGAFWYCTKYPVDIEAFIYHPTDFMLSIIHAFEKRELERERGQSQQKLLQGVEQVLARQTIIGDAPAISTLKAEIAKYAASNASILITGPSGTGKELIASNIHYRSARKVELFVPINCGSIPHELVESELFGFEKGAFTGATSEKRGLFEVANHGTIFLDEVGELPPAAQVKLLRVLQEHEIEKIGRTKRIAVDVRVIAATNKDLKQEVAEKRFREDLYYRLNVIPLRVPPLSERREDIPLLINHFLTLYSGEMKKEKPTVPSDSMELLCNYDWPGNVRELMNVVQRLLFNDERTFSITNVLHALGVAEVESSPQPDQLHKLFVPGRFLPLRQAESIFREQYLLFARLHSTSDADAARKIGVAPSNYLRMMKELGMK